MDDEEAKERVMTGIAEARQKLFRNVITDNDWDTHPVVDVIEKSPDPAELDFSIETEVRQYKGDPGYIRDIEVDHEHPVYVTRLTRPLIQNKMMTYATKKP